MNRIDALIERMRIIPGKERRATQLQDMLVVRNKLREAGNRAVVLSEHATALTAIKGAAFIGVAKQGLAKVASRASALKKRHDDGLGFDRKRADQTLTLVNEGLDSIEASLGKGWRNLIDEQTRRYRPLADAAEQAQMPGASGLNEVIELLEGWRENPPSTAQAAQSYLSHASSLPTAIEGLGLEGRAGQFMVDASKGQAKAKDLQDADVLDFLKDHPAVWSMLKVSL